MRIVHVLTLGALALGSAGLSTAAAPPPLPPIFEASLKHNVRCLFRMTAKWERTQVATLNAQWYQDNTLLFATDAPSTGEHRAIMSGNAAMIEMGPTNTSGNERSWKVLVRFLDGNGQQLAALWTNVDNARCVA